MVTSLNSAIPARDPGEQNVVAKVVVIAFNDVNIGSGNRQVATLPQGAIIIGTDSNTATAFNGTTPALTLGTNNPTSDNIVGAGVAIESAGFIQATPPTGTAIGPLANDTPVYVKFVGAGATTGLAQAIIRYVLKE